MLKRDILYNKGLPILLLTNNMILIYASSRTHNSGDGFWYILMVVTNMLFILLDLINVWSGDVKR